MPAQNKDELLAITVKEFEKLKTLIEPLDDDIVLSGNGENLSIKDVIGHRAHWAGLFLHWYESGQSGKNEQLPAPGYKWNELPRYNASIRQQQANMSWQDVKELLDRNTAALLGLVESLTNDQLYGGPMKGGNEKWTTGRWAEASGASHFRSAVKYIRSRLRDLAN